MDQYGYNYRDQNQRNTSARDDTVSVYVDGSCKDNGTSYADAGIGVHWPSGILEDVSEPLRGSKQTNIRAEMQAAITAIKMALEIGIRRLKVHTDSKFVCDCVDEDMQRWKDRGWKRWNGDVPENLDLVKELDGLVFGQQGMEVRFKFVASHSGDPYNDKADRLANKGAKMHREERLRNQGY